MISTQTLSPPRIGTATVTRLDVIDRLAAIPLQAPLSSADAARIGAPEGARLISYRTIATPGKPFSAQVTYSVPGAVRL